MIRSRLDHVRSNLHKSVQKQQSAMKHAADRCPKMRQFTLNDTVLAKVTEIINPVIYIVELQDGTQVRRHVDHMRYYTPAHDTDYDTKREKAHQHASPQAEVSPPSE